MDNADPKIKECTTSRVTLELIDGKISEVNRDAVFELIRNIRDPEHPYTLEQLGVVEKEDIEVGELFQLDHKPICQKGLPIPHITMLFKPTVPHCSMAGIIGLSLIYQLQRHTAGYWIRVGIKEDTHANYIALNKQLGDRERVLAAFENDNLLSLLESCIDSA